MLLTTVLLVAATLAAGSGLLFVCLRSTSRILCKRKPIELDLSGIPISSSGRQFGLIFAGLRSTDLPEETPPADDGARSEVDQRHPTGNVGELLTAMIMVSRGWQQLPTQPIPPHGIDGLFVRKRKSHRGWEIAFVETKASTIAFRESLYDQDTWPYSKIVKRLKKLKDSKFGDETFFLPPPLLDALVEAFERHSLFISSQLFVHNFDLGETKVYDLEADHGQRSDQPVEHLGIAGDDHHRAWFRSLAIGLGRLLYHKPLTIEQNSVALPGGLNEGRETSAVSSVYLRTLR